MHALLSIGGLVQSAAPPEVPSQAPGAAVQNFAVLVSQTSASLGKPPVAQGIASHGPAEAAAAAVVRPAATPDDGQAAYAAAPAKAPLRLEKPAHALRTAGALDGAAVTAAALPAPASVAVAQVTGAPAMHEAVPERGAGPLGAELDLPAVGAKAVAVGTDLSGNANRVVAEAGRAQDAKAGGQLEPAGDDEDGDAAPLSAGAAASGGATAAPAHAADLDATPAVAGQAAAAVVGAALLAGPAGSAPGTFISAPVLAPPAATASVAAASGLASATAIATTDFGNAAALATSASAAVSGLAPAASSAGHGRANRADGAGGAAARAGGTSAAAAADAAAGGDAVAPRIADSVALPPGSAAHTADTAAAEEAGGADQPSAPVSAGPVRNDSPTVAARDGATRVAASASTATLQPVANLSVAAGAATGGAPDAGAISATPAPAASAVVAPAASAAAAAPVAASKATGAAPAPATAQVAQAITAIRFSAATPGHISIQLQPAELGSVRVDIQRGQDGATISLSVEKPATLQALQMDAPHLHAALDRAGIATDGRQVTFHLASASSGQGGGGLGTAGEGGQQSRQGGWGRQPAAPAQADTANGEPDTERMAAELAARSWPQAGVNITA